MSDLMTCSDTANAISSPASACGPTHCGAPAGPTTVPCGQAPAPANLSPRQAKAAGLMTSGTSGRTGTGSSLSADLQWCLENRLRAALSTSGSTLYKLTWKRWTTPMGVSRFRLRASVPRTSEIERSGWPTPTAALAEKGVRSFEGGLIEAMRNHGPDLAAAAACLTGWPTPTTTDFKGAPSKPYSERGGGKKGMRLDAATHHWLSGWNTPAASDGNGRQRWEAATSGHVDDRAAPERAQGEHGLSIAGAPRLLENGAGPTNGFWRAADWLLCRDGKWRPVEPGTFPLAHGAPARVGRLRAYGNAVNGEATVAFILAARARQSATTSCADDGADLA